VNDARRRALIAAVDRVLPAGTDSPGAVELGAPDYIERALAAEHAGSLPAYERGLDALDAAAIERCGTQFAELAERDRDELLGSSELLELLRLHTIQGCFGDPRWGGNADGRGWELLGWPPPRDGWTEAEQELA
jgi:gluconate 2-dehydrogenase gamma chain